VPPLVTRRVPVPRVPVPPVPVSRLPVRRVPVRRLAVRGVAAVVALAVLPGCSATLTGAPAAAPSPAPATSPTVARGAPATGTSTTAPPGATVAPVPRPGAWKDPRGRFSLVPPPGWTTDTSGTAGTAVLFADPRPTVTPQGQFRANVNVVVVPATAALADIVAGARTELTGLSGYRATTDASAALADGTPAHRLGGTFTDSRSAVPLRNLQLIAVGRGSTVVVTGTAPAGSWDAFTATFDTVLRSVLLAG
jgi:hypothetical protein